MFIKSEKQESIINLDRVCSIQKDGYDIMFYYTKEDFDFDYWRYDSESARDKDLERIVRHLSYLEI